MRAFGDGFVAILLPVHLARLGFGAVGTGLIATSTLLGLALLTLGLGFVAHRVPLHRGLLAAALLVAGTGLGFACLHAFWPLLLVAFVGTLNPSGGDVSVFLPLEHTLIARLATDWTRTAAYARYSFVGAIGAAMGSLAIGSLDWLERILPPGTAASALFLLYGVIGLATLPLYGGLPEVSAAGPEPTSALGPSRRRACRAVRGRRLRRRLRRERAARALAVRALRPVRRHGGGDLLRHRDRLGPLLRRRGAARGAHPAHATNGAGSNGILRADAPHRLGPVSGPAARLPNVDRTRGGSTSRPPGLRKGTQVSPVTSGGCIG